MEDDKRKREGAQLLLRFNEGSDMRERLKQIAALNGRTLTAEILHRLEKSFDQESQDLPVSDATLEQRITMLEDALRTHFSWHMGRNEDAGVQ